jgi:dTDP-6-deoxy-L-talose 4-dehydrogenase (NAD+)
MKMRVMLTGATGFVGRQILKTLLKAKVDLRLVLREGSEPPTTQVEAVDIVRTADLFKQRSEWWADACEGVDIVIHAAWYTEPHLYMQSMKNFDCLAGTLQLASGCVQAGVKRLVGIGSCSEYDMSLGHLSVNTPLRPTTPYAGAKAATFLALSTMLPQHGVVFAWARLFYLYGEGEDARRLVPYLRSCLSAGKPAELTSGTQIRDYLNVADAGAQIASLALGTQTGALNICSGHAQTVRELAEKIADEYGRRDLLQFGVRAENVFDPPCVVGIRSTTC